MFVLLAVTTAALVEQVIAGAIAGAVRGIVGYYAKREPGEDLNVRKFGRTVAIFAAAGILVALGGDPITEGNIAAATGTTFIVGFVFDDLYSLYSRERREANRAG